MEAEPLRVIELFAGVGSQTQALKNIGVPHKVVAISEIDKYCDASYRALHNKEVLNLGDIKKITMLPAADLWTYSFPCTDISLAGKLAGLAKGSGTRSGLLWEVERLLLVADELGWLPKYLLLENVKNLVGKKFKADYEEWLAFLNTLGYKSYWSILNAKDYKIPQNRERVFCVSIRGDEVYEFPQPVPLELRLRDMLQEEVPDKYWITNDRIKSMLTSTFNTRRTSIVLGSGIIPTLCARDWREPKCVVVGSLADEKYAKMHDISRRVYDEDGISPTIHTCGGGNTEPKVLIGAMRGRNPDNPSSRKAGEFLEQRLEVGGEVANTLTTVYKDNLVVESVSAAVNQGARVRKLTPRECWHLMGWTDDQIDKVVATHISNTQMYKQAGNGIVVSVLEAIFKELFADRISNKE